MVEERKSGEFVTPGSRIAIIEEFIPGRGTYVDDGVIYSKITGYMLIDNLNKEVSVYPAIKLPKVPTIGSVVIGIVNRVKKNSCDVEIIMVGRRKLTGSLSGTIHISDASPNYVGEMYDVCRAGDYVKAEVISTKNGTFHLSTMGREFGVVLAFCSRCGYPLSRRKRMYCSRCGNAEGRKVAEEYWFNSNGGGKVKN